ncbi:MAG: hypothetical protein ACREI2_01410 [Nitrospiraceae bacterium]
MTQWLDPTIVNIEVMDRNRLLETRAKYRPLVRLARWHFWRLWLRNRFAYVTVLAFYLFLIAGAFRLWIGHEQGMSGWAMLGAIAISWSVTWLFVSHTPMNAFFERWRVQEQEVRETLDMHLYTLCQIRRRSRTLARRSGI